MNSQEIARRAAAILQYKLPSHWIVRSQEDQNDVGIDFEFEVLENKETDKGALFKGQLKGTQYAQISGDWVISPPLKVPKLGYYMENVTIPIVLIVVVTCPHCEGHLEV